MIVFACQQCGTRFKVADNLAGKKGRCKKCGQPVQIPQPVASAAAVGATGMFRLGAVQADQVASPPPGQPAAKSRRKSDLSWSMRRAPISRDNLRPVSRDAEQRAEEDEPAEYKVARPVDAPAAKRSSPSAGPRGGLLWGPGGIAEVLLVALRKFSDYAYLVSVPFLLLIFLAVIIKQRELAVLAAVVVILLNIVRLGIDGFALAALAFKNGPLQGILFFIPPFTFYYLNKRGKVLQEALKRFLGPAVPIIGVVLLFMFVPWLRGGEVPEDATIGERLRSDLKTVEENIKIRVDPQDAKD